MVRGSFAVGGAVRLLAILLVIFVGADSRGALCALAIVAAVTSSSPVSSMICRVSSACVGSFIWLPFLGWRIFDQGDDVADAFAPCEQIVDRGQHRFWVKRHGADCACLGPADLSAAQLLKKRLARAIIIIIMTDP